MKIPSLLRISVLFYCLAGILGCSSYQAAKTYEFDQHRVYALSYDHVWNRIVDWFARNNLPLRTLDKASGLITTELSTDGVPLCDCGTPGTEQAFVGSPSGNANITVRPDGSGVRVTIYVKFAQAMKDFSGINLGPKSSTIECNSTGVFENRIFSFLSDTGY